MNQFIALLVTLGFVGSCFAAGPAPLPNVQPCDSNANYPLSVTSLSVFNATWSCTAQPCVIYKGANVSIMMTFENNGIDTVTSLVNQVYGIYLHITVPFPDFPAEDKDVCKLAVAPSACPIKKGDKFTEKLTLPVTNKAFSGMQVVAKWELVDGADSSKVDTCVEFLLKIG